MPELPEVRNVQKALKKDLLNKKITNIKVLYPKIIDEDSLDIKFIINQKLNDIKTYGKYLIFEFDNNILLSHLRMEGKYFIKNIDDNIVKHEHIIFEFNNISLRYHDTRKFGRMMLINKDELYSNKYLNKLGFEPFNSKLTKEYLKDKLNKNKPIKELLLDQSIITGLGNIYANEVLFASKINPLKLGKNISIVDADNIINSSRSILEKAIIEGGTTIKSYTSSLGVIGNYQNFLLVHKKEGEPCKLCGNPIIKIKVGGRSTYYCKECQK